MPYAKEILKDIWQKTDGRCHLCSATVRLSHYGVAWEVDHSTPRAKGGTDRASNLQPACVTCNRSKQARSTRSKRRENGLARRPMSKSEKEDARQGGALFGAASGAAAGGLLAGPVGLMIGGILGGLLGGNVDPEK